MPRADVTVILRVDEVFKIADSGFSPGTYNHELRYTVVNSSDTPVCVMTHDPAPLGIEDPADADRKGVAARVDGQALYFWDPTANMSDRTGTIHRVEPGAVEDIRLIANGSTHKISLRGGRMERDGIMASCP